MKSWQKAGGVAFWLTYPALWLYLRFSWRTRALIVVGDEVLMVKAWLGTGKWQLPGGGVHRGERLQDGAVREVQEETSLKLRPSQLKLFYQDWYRDRGLCFKYSCYSVVLSAKPPIKRQRGEIVQISWLPLSEITRDNATSDTFQAVQAWLRA